ncbi:MAG TPA: hypothetical protein VFD37_02565 [Solirubrobacterales bacterium]|nr:hypothetical protein [Solirubrobacterales bacterium]
MRRLLLLGSDQSGPVAQAPPVPLRQILTRFWPYLRPYRKWIPVLLAMQGIANLRMVA